MSFNSPRRIGAVIGAAALVGGLFSAPSAAVATTYVAEESAGVCVIDSGEMSWGLKESFRAYISGSIANGSWEVSDGAEYEIPNFVWKNPTGFIDPETGTGEVSFTGTIHFTGHDGVLDLTLANPTIEFEGDGSAALLLDARSTDMEGEVVVDNEQEWVAALTVSDTLVPVDNVLSLTGIRAALTNPGADSFAGFYEPESELDPINLTLGFEACDTGDLAPADPADPTEEPADTPEETPEPTEEAPVAPDNAQQQIPWAPIIIGGVAILVIGVTVGMLLSGRKKTSSPASTQDSGTTEL